MERGLFSSNRMDWETPQALFDELNAEFGFSLDAAASESNAKCPRFFTERENGLIQSWGGMRFLQSALRKACRRMGEEGAFGIEEAGNRCRSARRVENGYCLVSRFHLGART